MAAIKRFVEKIVALYVRLSLMMKTKETAIALPIRLKF